MADLSDNPPLPGDMAQLWFLVHRVGGLLDRSGEAMFRASLDVSLARFMVLSVIDAHPGALNQQAIADRIGLTKGTVSRQIESAAAAGLVKVEASPYSRREKLIELTEAGTQLVRRGDELVDQARAAQLPPIPPPDLAATLRTLTTLYQALSVLP